MEEKKIHPIKKQSRFAWVALIVVALMTLFVGNLFVSQITDLEHYKRVYDKAEIVAATVTSHDSYFDSDGDEHFRSYITYVYDRTKYKDFPYESVMDESKLTPIGQQVTVAISPEDPKVQVAELKKDGRWVLLTGPFLVAVLSAVWMELLRSRRSKDVRHTPDDDTIQHDVKLTILARFSTAFFLLLGVGFAVLLWAYPMVFADWMWSFAGVSAAIWLWCLYRSARDWDCVSNREYDIRRETLVNKKSETDSEGDITYTLYYRSQDNEWSRTTTSAYYFSVKVGDTVTSIYLPGTKRPILHYDTYGEAQ